jgi:uncharacterized membrane protein YfhO
MAKETVVRQNRCDREMNFLLFGCYFFFLAMQLFISDTARPGLVNGINMALYMVFVPGFLFYLGYNYHRYVCTASAQERTTWLKRTALRYYGYFFVLAFAFSVYRGLFDTSISRKELLCTAFADVLSLLSVPAVAAVFLAMTITLLFAWGMDRQLIRLFTNKKAMAAAGILLLFSALLRRNTPSYTFVAALIGENGQTAVPAVPYFAFFLLGAWIEEKKPAFQWKLLLISAAVTAVSLLCYRTPLQDLCRVSASFLPVYLVYVLAEGGAELTIRSSLASVICDRTELIFGLYAAVLFLLGATGTCMDIGVKNTFLVAVSAGVVLLALYLAFKLFVRCYQAISDYFHNRVRHKTAFYFLIYTLVFAVLLLLVFADFLLQGKTFIILGDGVSQYFPRVLQFARYIREMIGSLFSGSFTLPMYDFRNGLGAEVTYSLEPLYFIYALFDEEHMELAYNLVTVLRFYLAGVTSSVLFLYFKKDYFSAFMGSVVYVFCGFALYGGAMHTMFMIPMIMLPLLILSIEEILRHRRFYLCSIFVAISLLSNYYFLYMNTIAMGIYFIVRFLCQEDRTQRTGKKFIGRGLVISGSYLLGVGIGCMTLFTTFGKYLGSGRKGSVVIKTASLLYYRAEWLLSCFQTFLTTANSPGEWLKLGYLPIAMLAVAILFSRKGRKELKIFSVIAVLFMAFPVFGFIFSGFSTVINRWCYMVSLLVGFVVADCLPDLLAMKKRDRRICFSVVLVYGFFAFFGKYYKNTSAVKIAALLLLVTFILLLLCHKQNRSMKSWTKKSLLLIWTAVLVFYQGYSLYEVRGRISQYASTGYTQQKVEDTPLQAVSELEDDDFYRVTVPKLSYNTGNASMLLDYYSTSLISSTYNGSINQYLRMMGNTSYSSMQYLGMNNRLFENALAAVKYYASYKKLSFPLPFGYEEVLETTVNGKTARVYENQYALPLGYTYDSVITEEELEQYDVLERQEVLMQKVLLHSAEESTGEAAAVTTKELEISGVREKGVTLTEHALTAGEGAAGSTKSGKYRITLQFTGEENSETYLVLHGAFLEGDMSEEPIDLTIRTADSTQSYSFEADDYRYHTGQEDFVFNLGYHEEAITSCTITMKREGVIQFESLGIYSQPMDNVPAYTEALTQSVLENVTVGTNTVSGTISADQDKILVLSIPYQNGWTAYVDGEEMELTRANYMYMALPITAGEHTIELTFAIPGVKYALVITPVSVVLLIIISLASWIIRKRKKKTDRSEE